MSTISCRNRLPRGTPYHHCTLNINGARIMLIDKFGKTIDRCTEKYLTGMNNSSVILEI
jgi:hypothetical protein